MESVDPVFLFVLFFLLNIFFLDFDFDFVFDLLFVLLCFFLDLDVNFNFAAKSFIVANAGFVDSVVDWQIVIERRPELLVCIGDVVEYVSELLNDAAISSNKFIKERRNKLVSKLQKDDQTVS